MRIEPRPIQFYEIGDYVHTGDGVGRVCKTDEDPAACWSSGTEHTFQRVWVQHKFGISGNPSNQPKECEGFSLILKSEYDDEQF